MKNVTKEQLAAATLAETIAKNLPRLLPETRAAIAALITDPPPSGKHKKASEAIAAKEILPGLSQENVILKAARVALWAAVYFPRQPIPYYVFLTWYMGRKITQTSPQISQFIKDKGKVSQYVDSLGLIGVSYATQRRTSRPESVDGFRFTVDGNDYVERIHHRNMRKANKSLAKLAADLLSTRISPEIVDDDEYRQQVEDGKKVVNLLKADGVLAYLAVSTTPRLQASSAPAPTTKKRKKAS